jgi:non-heme chloroperoxidase
MSTITTKDGTEIYYKDWGSGPVVTFSHGWPLNADAWDGQMLFLVQNGYRCVALDRRGHGRSSQASDDALMNTFPASDPVSIEQSAPPAADQSTVKG